MTTFPVRLSAAVLLSLGIASAGEPTTSGKLTVAEFAKTGMVGSAVGITTDPRGRVYVTSTNRRTNGAVDIRKVPGWLLESLACTTIAEKRALIHRRMPDWQKLEGFKEQIICLEDGDGDGVADKRTLAFEGFGTDINGVAAGVLWHDGALYVTCFPSFYRLTDPDGDGVFDKQEELVTGMGIHVGYGGHDMHGPTLGVDGRIWWSMGDKGYHIEKEGRTHYGPGMGAVFRCEPDGSGFEVFCTGVRNPFELAFDAHGNLFTVDHDGDFGDQEGIRFLVEGSDSGWRAHFQYREGKQWPEPGGYNPWMADGLWKPPFPGQSAHVTPVFATYSAGPIGFEWEPGTALNPRYRGYFFLAESPKKTSAFRLVPQGAGFAPADAHVVASGPFATGLFFAADGGLYAADWGDNEWLPHNRGRVIRLDDPAMAGDAARAATRKLLAEGMAKRPEAELGRLLAHADQRVRLQAQLALVGRGAAGRAVLALAAAQDADGLLARLHAMWGLGQLARRGDGEAARLLPLLLADPQAEVRAQAAKLVGEAGLAAAAEGVARLLADPEPRPRLMAGVALARLARPEHLPLAVALLAANDDRDVYLRHAGVMALTGAARGARAPLVALAGHASRAVRLAAVVALRRLGDAGVARFLDDADQAVAAEAARAIHDDLSIPAALPALAGVLKREDRDDEPLLRRAISANLRLGDADSAQRLALFAQRRNIAGELRAEAIDSLAAWLKPLALDRVQGFHRGLPARDRALVVAAVGPALETLLFGRSKSVQAASARLIAALELPEWVERLSAVVADPQRDAALRSVALGALETLKAPTLDAAVERALGDPDGGVRVTALGILARQKPGDEATHAALAKAAASPVLADRQQAIAVLGTIRHKRAVAALDQRLDAWKSGTLEAALRLDVAEAVRAQGDKALAAKLAGIEKELLKADPRGLAVLALEGGDPKEGERLFRGGSVASCQQCHAIGAAAGAPPVGPDLAHIGKRLDRARLLTALLDPSAEIAEGFGQVNLTLKDGAIVSGALVSEDATAVTVRPLGGAPQAVAKESIAARTRPVSIMPPMGATLSRVELRHLIAFLAALE